MLPHPRARRSWRWPRWATVRLRTRLVLAFVLGAALTTALVTALTQPTGTLPAEVSTPNPLAGATFWRDPGSPAALEARARAGDPVAATALRRIADQPTADWFVGDTAGPDLTAAVAAHVARVRSVRATALLVAYAIPNRDLGGDSAGGVATAAAYQGWIRAFAAGIGPAPAVVVLEPDSLAQLDQLAAGPRQQRLAALRDAVTVLTALPHTTVYLDGGHSTWVPPAQMAPRLRDAGVALARGFALNVANYNRTADEAAYGEQLAAMLPGAHYIVDTGRNGSGPAADAAWCNPPGRTIGRAPTTATGVPHADAYLWIKQPGLSDGSCGRGEPAAGTWWPERAIELGRVTG